MIAMAMIYLLVGGGTATKDETIDMNYDYTYLIERNNRELQQSEWNIKNK
ncbi:hypothetical protein AGMMS50222_07720 [Endomicrobiia bacterium]|nr:hypothetical protein AGMMS49531_05450 [Endomicrobiia bacterium]GHT65780.1 hypothetical protein AGMMS49556_06080 [Endomicrobiia bacterium]GHT69920.1 hypothetical protein AGMMS49950_03680 [Endomicrobiia bacterium]GHT75888.1 hypothetical protein AGMMS50222_07720 [Endomicrobiia bacterium]